MALLTGLPIRTVNRIFATALERGFDPQSRPLTIKNALVEDAPRPGRPTKQTQEVEEAVLSMVLNDSCGREKTCSTFADDLGEMGHDVSRTTVWRILCKNGLNKPNLIGKPTVKRT